MNVRPILIIRFPHVEGMSYNQYIQHIQSHSVYQEYHVLFLKENNRDSVGFEVLNVLDHDPIKIEQLEKIVLDSFTEENN